MSGQIRSMSGKVRSEQDIVGSGQVMLGQVMSDQIKGRAGQVMSC